MRGLVVLGVVALALASTPARADNENVGVVVITATTGSELQTEVAAHLESWMRKHDHPIVPSPLSRDAVNTIANCFVIDDLKCARGVVEARSKSDAVVFTRIEVGGGKDVTFTTYWFVKGHEVISERRVCEKCTDDDWRSLLDATVTRLTQSDVATGKLHLESRPSGLLVLIDNKEVGATPFDAELPVGAHAISLSHAGVIVATKDIEVHEGKLKRLTIETAVDTKPSRVGPGLLLGAGIGLIGGGGIALYLGEQRSDKVIHPEYVPVGIGLIAAGAGATIVGAILLSQSGHTSAPVAAFGRDSGYIGWVTRF